MTEAQAIQMQEETNRIVNEIESQKLDNQEISTFIYAFFIVVAISMVFEGFVKSYRESIHDKKKENKTVSTERKKLLIIYFAHILLTIIMWAICKFAIGLPTPYLGFLIGVTVYMVEIAPLFTVYIKLKKEVKDDSSQ